MNNVPLVDRCDDAIQALLKDPDYPAQSQDRELAELMRVAADLRLLPDPDFKERLKGDLLGIYITPAAPGRLPAGSRREREFQKVPTFAGLGDAKYLLRTRSALLSVLVHVAAIALVATSALWMVHPRIIEHPAVQVLFQAEALPLRPAPAQTGGGGSGGDRDKLAASKGNPPKLSMDPVRTPPVAIARAEHPTLPVQETVMIPPQVELPHGGQTGDPLSSITHTLSNGPGYGGGLGGNHGGGIGDGDGAGMGQGHDMGAGGSYFSVGGGVTEPVAIYQPDPDYSDEARRAKFQGTVVLWVIVGANGHPTDTRVRHSVGMGLDEKAMETVRTWRFRPGTKDGKPVPVLVQVEVSFHLY